MSWFLNLVTDQAACDPRIVGTVLESDLIPYITVFFDLVAGRFDFRAVVELCDDLALEVLVAPPVTLSSSISLIAMFIISVIVFSPFYI